MWASKKYYLHGTKLMTRSNALLQQIGGKITWTANKYRTIRKRLVALSSLLPDDNWHKILKPLLDSDLVGLTLFDESDHIGIDGDGLDDRIGGRRVHQGKCTSLFQDLSGLL
jgi:hypothetical protein